MFGRRLDHSRTGLDVAVDRPGKRAPHYVIQHYYAAWPIKDTQRLQQVDDEELILMTNTSWKLGRSPRDRGRRTGCVNRS